MNEKKIHCTSTAEALVKKDLTSGYLPQSVSELVRNRLILDNRTQYSLPSPHQS